MLKKILVTVPKKFEATIASLENSMDLSSMTLVGLVKIGECTMLESGFFMSLTQPYKIDL